MPDEMLRQDITEWPRSKFKRFERDYGNIPSEVQEEILRIANDFQINGEHEQKTAIGFLEFVQDSQEREKIAFKALENGIYGVRSRAVKLLGSKAIPRLNQFLNSDDQSFRLSGVAGLGDILTTEYDFGTLEGLTNALDDPAFGIWSNALRSLNQVLRYYSENVDFGNQVLHTLIRHERAISNEIISRDEGWTNKNEATYSEVYFEVLSDLKLEDIVNIDCDDLVNFMIESGLTSPNGTVRRYCWYFLAHNRIENVPVEKIATGLVDDHPNAQLNAMQYLGVSQSEDLIPFLIERLTDGSKLQTGTGMNNVDTTIRVGAFQSLARIGSEVNLNLLIEIYETFDDNERFQVLPHIAKGNWSSSAKAELAKLLKREIERGKTENMLGEFKEKIFGKTQTLEERATSALNHIENT
ncbi:HEAT repeat domain-containing protein [Candidatus Poseidoniales archaeon]|nr:HEAT repeat domain-containing protein [Candidatus Poseidoniales archaeon]